MTPKENLKDITDKRILKTKMYSFDEVRKMFELERQRMREEIEKRIVEWQYLLINTSGLTSVRAVINDYQQVLAILSEEKGK
jgi:hypothetical protein